MSKGPARAKPYVPKKTEQTGAYNVIATVKAPSGTITTHEITVYDAKGKTDAMNKATNTFAKTMVIVKITAFFLGLFGIVALVQAVLSQIRF